MLSALVYSMRTTNSHVRKQNTLFAICNSKRAISGFANRNTQKLMVINWHKRFALRLGSLRRNHSQLCTKAKPTTQPRRKPTQYPAWWLVLGHWLQPRCRWVAQNRFLHTCTVCWARSDGGVVFTNHNKNPVARRPKACLNVLFLPTKWTRTGRSWILNMLATKDDCLLFAP